MTAPRWPETLPVRHFCRAPHPDKLKAGYVLCSNLMAQDIPAGYRFVEVRSERPPEGGDGRMWMQCSRASCKAWNVFERVDAVA